MDTHPMTPEMHSDTETVKAAGRRPMPGFLRPLLRQSYLLLGIVIVFVVGTLASPYFLTGTNLKNIVVTGAVVSVLAVGQFMVIVTAGIDLSVGSVAALSTVVAAVLLQHGYPWELAAVITLVVCTFAGFLNGLTVVFARITPFIVTLAMLSIAEGVAFLVQGGTLIVISDNGFVNFFDGTLLGLPAPVVMFLVVMVIFAVIMRWTTFGRQQYAIGGNPEAARLSGLPVRRNLIGAYSVSGLLAGLAGLMLAAQLAEGSSLLAQGYELNAIAAAVVGGASLFGGTGSPVAAVLGGLLIGTISDIMNLRNIQAQPQLIIYGLLILLAVYLTSGGGAGLGGRLGRHLLGRLSERSGRPGAAGSDLAGTGSEQPGVVSPGAAATGDPAVQNGQDRAS